MIEGDRQRLWKSNQKRESGLVFIDRGLPRDALERGFEACPASAERRTFAGLLLVLFYEVRPNNAPAYSAASAAADKLSSEEMMCSESASASADCWCGLRSNPTRHEGNSAKPPDAPSTRMPGRRPDSGNTETASPASTAAATPPAPHLRSGQR